MKLQQQTNLGTDRDIDILVVDINILLHESVTENDITKTLS